MSRVALVHITDTLESGGAERVAVNLANQMASSRWADRYDVGLCSTRREGPLASLIGPDVRRLKLRRAHVADIAALRRLVVYNQTHRIDILHAHSTSVFIAAAAAAFPPFPSVVWHDHFGASDMRERSVWVYRAVMCRVAGVIAVNHRLHRWAVDRLRVPASRVWYLPNFVAEAPGTAALGLPGIDGYRVISVANFRPQKDHLTMLAAFASVVRAEPRAHLVMVGSPVDAAYQARVAEALRAHGLQAHVTVLGERHDVPDLLRACDIGLIGSRSEGLPLAVLEYGSAALPVVATEVGQLPDVLDHGRAGMLVPAGSAGDMASALLSLLASRERRQELGRRLFRRVRSAYSADAALRQLSTIYDTVLPPRAHAA